MVTEYKGKQIRSGSSGSYNGGYVSDIAKISTADNTATVIYSIPMALSSAVSGRALVVGKKSDSTASIGAHVTNFSGRRGSSGNVAEPAAETVVTGEDSSGTPAVTVVANTTDQTIEIKVTGISAETYYWEAFVEYIKG